MKHQKIFRILTVVVVLPLLLMVIPSTPALAAPMINVSPASGAVGTMVTVTGVNFDSYKGDNIYIFSGSDEITTSPIVVPPTGSFSFSFNIPASAAPGKHWIRAKSELTTLALSTFTVIKNKIKLDTEAGEVGTEVTIDGEGFYADRVVTFFYDNRTRDMLGTIAATAIGEFSYSFTIPGSAAGKHKITAENAEGNSAEAEFEVIPLITLSPTSGAIGEVVTVSGTGFGSRSVVAIYFRYTEVAYAKTTGYGNFTVTFNVPALAPGTCDVKAQDGDENTDKARFTIIAGASLDRTTGNVGMGLTVSGTGFIAGGTVTVKYDDATIVTIIADSKGAFAATFQVPISKYGDHTITASDGVNTKQLAFTIESEAPPIPALLLPAYTGEVEAKAHFDWRDVTDLSLPITYSLQVTSERDFTSIVLEKSGLTRSEYTLTEGEKLAAGKPEAPYYWRVKAIDGAANESGWSAPWAFDVAAPPTPALLLPETGIKADTEVFFDWREVTNLSPPITYHLQVASDKNFASIVLEETGLTRSEYTLAEEEKLAAVKKEAPYYWRVKAIDSAANESEWSMPGAFHVGFTMPGWVIYLLIGLGALLIGFLVFWLGRRTAYYQSG